MSKLKELRTASGLSQSGLAEKSGISVRMIQQYEQGIRDINKAQAIAVYRLAEALACNVADILEK